MILLAHKEWDNRITEQNKKVYNRIISQFHTAAYKD